MSAEFAGSEPGASSLQAPRGSCAGVPPGREILYDARMSRVNIKDLLDAAVAPFLGSDIDGPTKERLESAATSAVQNAGVPLSVHVFDEDEWPMPEQVVAIQPNGEIWEGSPARGTRAPGTLTLLLRSEAGRYWTVAAASAAASHGFDFAQSGEPSVGG